MKDRLIKFLTTEGISATKFADEIGVQRSSISHILSGRNNPSFEFIQKILNRYRNLNAEWLIQGSGPMFKRAETIAPTTVNQENFIIEKKSQDKQPELFAPVSIIQNTTSVKEDISGNILSESKPSPSRKVEKILVFYSDKTFDEFFPSK